MAGDPMTRVGNALEMMMGESDSVPTTRYAWLAFALIGGLFAWRWMHPHTVLAADGDPVWDAAVERARDSGQPAVVLFTAGWCPACQNLHGVLDRDDVRRELHRNYTFVTVDLTRPSAAAQARSAHYGVSGIPLLIRYGADGKETERTYGLGPEALIDWLRAGE